VLGLTVAATECCGGQGGAPFDSLDILRADWLAGLGTLRWYPQVAEAS